VPPLTRTFLRAALLWLLLGLGLLLALAARPADLSPFWRQTAFHCITVGWLTQMIFGVAHWMFPRASRERPRGEARLGWLAFGLLNAGLLLRVTTEPLQWQSAGGGALALSGLLQFLGALAWVTHIWPRVKER
jgi:heme/copper-type cytochrome/quinol oxidase subunit 1